MYKLPEDLANKYRFVTLAARRAEQLQAGARPRVDTLARKMTVIAQEEVALGLVEEWDRNAPPLEVDEVAAGEPKP